MELLVLFEQQAHRQIDAIMLSEHAESLYAT